MASPRESDDEGVSPLSRIDYWTAHAARNHAAFWEQIARALDKGWAHWDDVWAADPQCPNPIPNAATLLRPLVTSEAHDLVARLSRFYAERPGAPWILESAWPTPDLQQWGFQMFGHLPLMVRLPGGTLPSAPAELRVVEVTDTATVADFERTLIAGYPIPELQPVQTGSIYHARGLGGPLRIWVGYLGDRAVTTAAALADDAVNGIYMVATLPEARGHGYGMAVTAQAVTACPSLPAVLDATDLGYPIYQRLGFTAVARYCRWLKPR